MSLARCKPAVLICLTLAAGAARAWGDVGHQTVALIAYQHLTPAAKASIAALMQNDDMPFTMRDGRATNSSFETEATWPDYYRDSDKNKGPRHLATRHWHVADIELDGGSVDQACYGRTVLAAGELASKATPDACIIDKIAQFSGELADPAIDQHERLLALKFLMHFVGDIHQPLHASDDHDREGNGKQVHYGAIKTGSLHHYWDTEFVLLWGATPAAIAAQLDSRITPEQARQWSAVGLMAWVDESNALGRSSAYGGLPALSTQDGKPVYELSDEYVARARDIVGTQMSKAGIRLAAALNTALR